MLSMRLRLLSFTAICLGLLPGDARAHKVTAVSAVARIDTQGRTYQLEMAMGVEPSETVVQNEQLPPETAARNFAEQSIQVYFDDQIAKPGIEVTTVQPDKEAPPEMQRLLSGCWAAVAELPLPTTRGDASLHCGAASALRLSMVTSFASSAIAARVAR